ncbi:hypothetical protein APHAL10511_001629 [Amanita phalloides]|nr:hypothetical protein APHAL10511_001629 [Amanita phalloides]
MNTEQAPPMQLSNSKHDNMAGEGTTPEQFLQYLRNLLTQYLSDDTPNRIRHTDGDWDTVILGLSDNFFASFLLPGSIPWNAMKEKLILLDSALEIIHRAAQQVDGLFSGQHDAACNLCVRLVNLCNALDVWLDRDVEVEDGVPLPIELRDKSFKALIALLRYFGGNMVRIRQSEEPRWKVLRHLLNEFVQLVLDLLSSTASVPISVMPFQTPRVQTQTKTVFDTDLRGKPVELSVTTPSQLAALLVLLVDVVTHALYPPVVSQWFLSDATFGLHRVFGSVFNHLLSTNCSLGIAARTKVLSSLMSSVTILCKHSTYADHFSHLAFRLLQYRALQDTECIEFDQIVLKANELHGKVSLSESDANEVIRLLCDGPSEQLSDLLAAYLRSILPRASEKLRRKVKQALSNDGNLKIRHEALLTEVEYYDATMAGEQVKDTIPQQVLSQAASAHWRQRVRVAVEAIVNKHHYSWMEIDGDDVTDRQYAHFNLCQIKDYFEGKYSKEYPTTKDEVVAKVSNLLCVLTRCDNTRCNGKTQYIDVSALLDILDLIVRGPTDQVTNAVHQQMYHILSHGIRHCADGASPVEWNRARDAVMKGIIDKDRRVRLAAGGALNALLEASSSDSESNEVTLQIFSYLYQVLETAKMPINETIIIAMGNCGETRNFMLLGQVLCLLIAQLGRPNPVIRGLACVKFLAIVKWHNKTPYSMIQLHLDQIAPFLISRVYSQPVLFHEACRVMGIPPNQFIVSNLSRALPQLFVDCEKAVLESVSKELGTKSSTLFLKYSHKILAHTFLQAGQTRKAVNFILTTLAANSHDASIDIASVIKSCLLPLLAELVVNLGDDSLSNVEMAKCALQEVQRYLMPNLGKGRSLPLPDLGAFLKNNILGILSGINDMLQGVQGRKSLDVKRKIVRSIGSLVTFIGSSVSSVAPQVMAILQTMIGIPEVSEPTIESWHQFLSVLEPADLGPHVGPTSAAFVTAWHYLNPCARDLAAQTLANIVLGLGAELGPQLDGIADLSQVEDLKYIQDYIQGLRKNWTSRQKLRRILHQCKSDNLTVSTRSLAELKTFMLLEQHDVMIELTSGDIFDPMTGKILEVLFSIACRDGDATQQLRLLAFECIGILGAVDPDRCETVVDDPTMIVLSNFTDENESMRFALHLISDLLVGAFRSTSDTAYQTRLAYAIQELLKFCQFTPALVAVGNSGGSVPLKVRNRWNQLPKRVLETVSPLLEARYTPRQQNHPEIQLPVYPLQSTYRDWIQTWTFHLINRVAGETAQKIFSIFRSIVRYKDVVVSLHILPHLVLNILISGNDDDVQTIRSEFLAVLEDQVDSISDSSFDKKLLSAQVVFMLLDHLNKWVRIIRQEINSKKSENKRARANQVHSHAEEQLLRVDSMLSSIDQHLMARAAFQCKAYARSLMNYESQILMVQRLPPNKDLPNYYEKIHEIYAHLDEPDGMEGVSTLILAPSLEHQIRQHESTGRWTSAQSCWELKLRQSPDNIDYHLGLLRCLRNLGHYDSLRTHVRGILTRNPEWESNLIGYELESAWIVGAWDDVKVMAERATIQTEHVAMARALLAMRSGDPNATSEALQIARTILGAPIVAAGVTGYRRAYDAVLNLHQMHELEKIYDVIAAFPTGSQPRSQLQRREILGKLSLNLTARLDATLPTFRTREPILSMRRTAFALTPLPKHMLAREVSRSWIASAKIARKANQWQTAYSAMLQAQQGGLDLSFVESAKLVKARGESLQALRELENAMRLIGYIPDGTDVLDLTEDDEESKAIKAKAQVLRARWMYESDRFGLSHVHKMFSEAEQTLPAWESGHFRLGQFHDECYKALSPVDKLNRGLKMNLSTVRSYAKAIKVGSKYVYQTVPRVLTIWLDLAERQVNDGKEGLSDAQAKDVREREALFKKVNDIVAKVIKDSPVYKWYTAFPQIVSRVGISNDDAYKHLSNLISRVIEEYPKQSLWLFTSVIKSTKDNRAERGRRILDRLRNSPSNARPYLSKLINQIIIMTNELLALCDCRVDDDKKQLSMNKDFPRLAALGRSELIIPLQESLTANLPPTSALESTHQPFPSDAPTFEEFSDEIDIMRSLAKPRKITIRGSNGQVYMFLGKPKDDLRKDARIMDFNSIVNKLLKANSESRRRQLHIRTYGVVTLNEECGFIQWVPNTLPIRPVLLKYYDAKRIRSWSGEMNDTFRKIKDAGDKDAGRLFSEQILPMFPPVFHEWFIETFPEPSAWFTSRLTYSRTAAVMSMVGFILGLGDRHCENILLDVNTGDVVHVDFNCLFEKGKTLETPERVPFRLTQNMVVGCGVTGIEGVFRIACEVTLQLLRDNKDSLMNVLDAFIHDPLVEWEDEKRKLEREPTKRNQVKASVDLGMLARNALSPIEKKLNGIHMTNKEKVEKECSTSTLVQILLQEATDLANLAKMYPGWAPWH